MASPLCVTLAVLIIIIISSEVKAISRSNSSRGTLIQPSVISNSSCSIKYTFTYGYSRFFLWANYIQFNKNDKDAGMSGATLHFRVRASSDAHVLLSTTENITDAKDSVYEIVIGAGRNTFTDLRRALRTATKATMPTPDIISGMESRGFWIRMSPDGTLSVGKEGDQTPFIAWRDPEPIQIKYFAFSTWNNIFGKWEYNCPDFRTNTEKEPDPDPDAELTDAERLRKNLLTEYNPFIMPSVNQSKVKPVFMHLASDMVQVNEAKSSIKLHGVLYMIWEDEKLIWNPEDYGGIKTQRLAPQQLWVPDFILYNAADGKGTNIFSSKFHLTVDHNGTVSWNPRISLEALCPMSFVNWPSDEHTCSFTIGVWAQASKITLQTHTEPVISAPVDEEWLLDTIIMQENYHVYHPFYEESFYYDEEIEEPIEEGIEMTHAVDFTVTVLRRGGHYFWMLFAPLWVTLLTTSFTFWMDPTGPHRLIFCFINFTLLIGIMLAALLNFPTNLTPCPLIIKFYSHSLIMTTFATLTCVLVKVLRERKIITAPHNLIMTIVLLCPGNLFCSDSTEKLSGRSLRRKIFNQRQDEHHQPLEEDEEVDDFKDVTSEVVEKQWAQVAEAIDFLCFVIFSITSIVMGL